MNVPTLFLNGLFIGPAAVPVAHSACFRASGNQPEDTMILSWKTFLAHVFRANGTVPALKVANTSCLSTIQELFSTRLAISSLFWNLFVLAIDGCKLVMYLLMKSESGGRDM